MTKRPPHLYLESTETHLRLKSAAARVGVFISALMEDVAQDVLLDLEDVPPGVTGAEARRRLRERRRLRRECYGRGPQQEACTRSRASGRYILDIRKRFESIEMNDVTSFACAAYLTARIAELTPPKAIEEISHAAGFTKPGTLQAVLAGEVALPLNRLFPLARAINCDRAQLFKLAVKDWRLGKTLLPMLEALEEFKVTEDELEVLVLLRQRLAGRELVVTDAVVDWVGTFPDAGE